MKETLLYEKNNIDIPVYEMNYKNVNKILSMFFKDSEKYLYDTEGDGRTIGLYFTNRIKDRFIFLYTYIPIKTKIWVLLHEKGHYICDKKKCKCLNNPIINEEHATVFALRYLLKNKYDISLFDYMINMASVIENYKKSPHSKSYRKILKSPLWKKCCKFLDRNKEK